ncbi:MAG TPA: helix-turn-helix domain-containing protein [Gemmatimonadaceae bacterium]|nr:helix-turn-helix domain-containing protein [Gemmatimonadaceae bacterium]
MTPGRSSSRTECDTRTHDDAAASYLELAPPPDLAGVVACTWVARTGSGESSPGPIIPDACSDIVVVGDAEPHVAGPATRTHLAPVGVGTRVVGIRFRPGATRVAFGCDANELLDAAPELRAVCGVAANALNDELSHAPTSDAMRAALERWVRARLARDPHRDADALAAANALVSGRARTVRELGAAFGWSARRVHREITATCGYGPKTLQRIVRMQRVVRRAVTCGTEWGVAGDGSRSHHRTPPLARLALDAGYADQAHMTRDFRDLTGYTPRELLARVNADVGRWLDGAE